MPDENTAPAADGQPAAAQPAPAKKEEKKEKKKPIKIPEKTPDGKPWPNGPDGKPLEVGPDGKPVPAVPLTEIQQVQLNIDKATDEVPKYIFILFQYYFINSIFSNNSLIY